MKKDIDYSFWLIAIFVFCAVLGVIKAGMVDADKEKCEEYSESLAKYQNDPNNDIYNDIIVTSITVFSPFTWSADSYPRKDKELYKLAKRIYTEEKNSKRISIEENYRKTRKPEERPF
jgi:hypothetical protein